MVKGAQFAGGGQLLGIGGGVELAMGLVAVGVNLNEGDWVGRIKLVGLLSRKMGKEVGMVVGVAGGLRVTLACTVSCSLADR